MRIKALLVARVVAVAVLLWPVVSFATGGSTWKVTVSNPSTHFVKFTVMYGDTCSYQVYVRAGESATFNVPGAHCPKGLLGEIYDDYGHAFTMKETSCLGTYVSYTAFTACCWNVSMKVCQKSGQGNWEMHDGDWAFCK
jgi:hypothetical protein